MESHESLIQSITHLDVDNQEANNQTVIHSPPRSSSWLILEPAVLLLFFSWSVASTVFQNQIIFQTCTVIFQYNETECMLLGTHNATNETELIEKTVQPYAAKIFMARTMIESIIPALASIFIGPWSDKYGRKPVIVSTFVGYFFIYFATTAISYLSTTMSVNPWFYLLPFIPISFCGGNCALITGVFCYVTDVSTEEDRAIRMAYLEASLYMGLLFGSISSSYVLALTSPTILFGIAAFSSLLGLLYVSFYVDESIQQDASILKCTKFKAIFDFKLVIDMFRTCFKSRENLNRAIIWITISTLVLSIFVLDGSTTVFYLFVREKFNWTIQQSTFYDAANIIVMTFGNIVGMYLLNKVLGISETTLAIVSYLSSLCDYLIRSIAFQPWQLYIGTGISMLRGISGPMCRSILSTKVPANEIGKIYSLTTAMESISPLASAPLYSLVYANTLNTFPGAFNLISAGIFLMCVVFMILVFICLKRSPQVIAYRPVDE